MEDYLRLRLTRQQKNDMFSFIRDAELDPAIFQFNKIDGTKIISNGYILTTLSEDGELFHFNFHRQKAGPFFVSFEPPVDSLYSEVLDTWDQVFNRFMSWVSLVHGELTLPDLWKTAHHNAFLNSSTDGIPPDEKFTPAEVHLILERLDRIEKFITDRADANDEQMTEIRSNFKYLKDRAASAPKLDWKNIFAGQILTMIIQFASDRQAPILSFCNEQLGPFFRHLLRLE